MTHFRDEVAAQAGHKIARVLGQPSKTVLVLLISAKHRSVRRGCGLATAPALLSSTSPLAAAVACGRSHVHAGSSRPEEGLRGRVPGEPLLRSGTGLLRDNRG